MIRGYCIGGGLGIAVCCDLRICTENSTFGVPAAKLGLGYGYAGVKRLVDLVGPAFAKEIFFTARQFNAEEAKTMGLVNRVVPDAELESYVKKYAETIAGNAPLTIKALKLVVGEVLKDASKRDVAAHGSAWSNACFKSKDYMEGRDAFMEKRKPVSPAPDASRAISLTDGRNLALDGVRGLAALSVALGHCMLIVAGMEVWSKTAFDFPDHAGAGDRRAADAPAVPRQRRRDGVLRALRLRAVGLVRAQAIDSRRRARLHCRPPVPPAAAGDGHDAALLAASPSRRRANSSPTWSCSRPA